MRVKLKRLFCRHRYDYKTNYITLDGVHIYLYVCPLCGKVKKSKKPLRGQA